jgi:two-component system, cell cycle response regulator DivK
MTKGRILFVEDNMDTYALVQFFMERNGYVMFLAVSGRDGVSAAIKQKPDLILMDLSLPEMDGWSAAKQIKSTLSTKSIPIIALTAHALVSDRKRALDAGCDDYIIKPIDMTELVRIVDQVLKH